jgi:undecaprenyl phosphate N,N'-diacetylbacillosamine 1-phosphate transferase
MYKTIFKPVSGWILALVFLIILIPVFILIIIILAFVNRGRIFFVQKRIGRYGRTFNLLKFKTMPDHFDAHGKLLPDKDRQSEFGNFLRHYHLDEIPQFLNILNNDLSLIGPRPLLPEYLPWYTGIEHIRHECKPGITGLVQVSGGNTLTWDQRMRLDVFYVRHISFGFDCIIMIRTFLYFFRKKITVSQSGIFSQESLIEYRNKQNAGRRIVE